MDAILEFLLVKELQYEEYEFPAEIRHEEQ